MERIKQALEQARKNRGGGTGSRLPRRQSGPLQRTQLIDFSKLATVTLEPQWLRRNRIVINFDEGPAGSAYKLLRTRLLQPIQANNWNVVALTSPTQGEGKSVTAINLAISIARMPNLKVLLVDLDLRRPAIHKYLGISPKKSLIDYLQGGVNLQDVILRTDFDGLMVLPTHQSIYSSSEMLSSPRMIETMRLFRALGNEDCIVIVDSPPVMAADDTLTILPYVDAALMVVEEGKTKKDAIVHSIDAIKDHQLLGIVLNKSSSRQSSYYYY